MRIEPAGKTGLFSSHENQPPWEDRCGPMIYYARPVVLQYLLYTRNTEYTQQRLKEYCHFFSDDGDDSTIFRSFLGYYYCMRIRLDADQSALGATPWNPRGLFHTSQMLHANGQRSKGPREAVGERVACGVKAQILSPFQVRRRCYHCVPP